MAETPDVSERRYAHHTFYHPEEDPVPLFIRPVLSREELYGDAEEMLSEGVEKLMIEIFGEGYVGEPKQRGNFGFPVDIKRISTRNLAGILRYLGIARSFSEAKTILDNLDAVEAPGYDYVLRFEKHKGRPWTVEMYDEATLSYFH